MLKRKLFYWSLTTLVAFFAEAHTTWQYFQVDGIDYNNTYIRHPSSNSPITDVSSANIACNVGGNTGVAGKAIVPAGANFTVEFHHNNRSTEAVDPTHKGPTLAYMAKVSDSKTSSATGLKWFKVFEDGYTASNKKWGVDRMNENGGKFSFKIPMDIANGDYFLRGEMIALQGAVSVGGAQFYFGCAQITVTGATGGTPSPAVSFPGAYGANDPGIRFRLDSTFSNYTIPGPKVYA